MSNIVVFGFPEQQGAKGTLKNHAHKLPSLRLVGDSPALS